MAENNNINYSRLIYLNQIVKDNKATKAEKAEYMLMLYNNNNITKSQYDEYLNSDKDVGEEIIKAALVISGFLLVVHLISKLFDEK